MVIPKAKLGECCTNFDKLLGAPAICKGSVGMDAQTKAKKIPVPLAYKNTGILKKISGHRFNTI
jgi:hypothetical protein